MHAALWALLAALLCWLAAPRAATRSGLWRLALIGPLTTTAFSTVWSSVAQLARGALSVASETHAAALASHTLDARWVLGEPPAPGPHAWASWSLPGNDMLSLLAITLLGCATVGVVRFVVSLALLRRVLRERTAVVDLRTTGRFERLRLRAGLPRVLLSESSLVPGPLVIGRYEVCLPRSLASTFDDGEIEAVLAHELAHLERRDGLWFPLVSLLDALLWVQPLQCWVSKRFRRAAELAADDRAVELTQAPLDLARALVRMTETTLLQRGRLLPAMASRDKVGVERVSRLMTLATRVRREDEADVAGSDERARGNVWPSVCLVSIGLLVPSLRAELASTDVTPGLRVDSGWSAQSAAAYQEEREALAQEAWAYERRIADYLARQRVSSHETSQELATLKQSLRHVHAREAWAERKRAASRSERGPAHDTVRSRSP